MRFMYLIGAVTLWVASGNLHAQNSNLKIVPLNFERSKGPPGELSAKYEQTLQDSKLAGVDNIEFSTAHYRFNRNTRGLFVRIESALTCSSNGECQTDVYTVGRESVLVLSVVAQNLAVEEDSSLVASDQDFFPALLSDVADGGATVGALWKWNGKKYELGGKK